VSEWVGFQRFLMMSVLIFINLPTLVRLRLRTPPDEPNILSFFVCPNDFAQKTMELKMVLIPLDIGRSVVD